METVNAAGFTPEQQRYNIEVSNLEARINELNDKLAIYEQHTNWQKETIESLVKLEQTQTELISNLEQQNANLLEALQEAIYLIDDWDVDTDNSPTIEYLKAALNSAQTR